MGGFGSGRSPQKISRSECHVLHIRDFKQIIADASIGAGVGLLEVPGVGDFDVRTTKQPRNGASRYWFVCPVCFKKRTKLYCPADAWRFWGCRQCWDLAYESDRACGNPGKLWELRTQKFRDRLKLPPNYQPWTKAKFLDLSDWDWQDPPRPKHMRQKTYRRIVAEWKLAEQEYLCACLSELFLDFA